MAIWSSLRTVGTCVARNHSLFCRKPIILDVTGQRVMSGHGPRLMPITPSRWQWHKFKDLLHFYGMLGLIPVGCIVFYVNVFIGPAQLADIPKDYVPKHWEYHKHPISRFLSRYILPNPQQEYEKYLHYVYEQQDKMHLRKLEAKIKQKMYERKDYQGYYYRPVFAKYVRISREEADKLRALAGDM